MRCILVSILWLHPCLPGSAVDGSFRSRRFLLVAVNVFLLLASVGGAGADEATVSALFDQIGAMYRARQYEEALPLAKRAVPMSESVFGKGHPHTAGFIHQLAQLYDGTGQVSEAEAKYKDALKIWVTWLAPDHSATLTCLGNLGRMYEKVGRLSEAEELYQRVLEGRRRTLGESAPPTLLILDRLGIVYDAMAQWEKAEACHLESLRLKEQSFGTDHPATADTLNNLASHHQHAGQKKRAEELYLRSLRIKENAPAPNPGSIAITLDNLSGLYKELGQYEKAEPLCARAVSISEGMNDSRQLAINLNNLAAIHHDMGDYAKAEKSYRRALEIIEVHLGRESREVAVALDNLGVLYVQMGDYQRAEPLLQRGLAVREMAQSATSNKLENSLNNLGLLYARSGDFPKAISYYERALEAGAEIRGEWHPSTALTLNNLAGAHKAMGKFSEAHGLFSRALDFFEKQYGIGHKGTTLTLNNLAVLSMDLRDEAGALKLARRAREGEETQLARILSFTSERQRLAFQATQRPFLLHGTLGSADSLAVGVLRNKGVILDSLLEDRIVAEAGTEEAHRQTIGELYAAKQQFAQMTLEVPRGVSEETMRARGEERAALAEAIEQKEAALAKKVAGLGTARRALEVTVDQVRKMLSDGQVLVELVHYGHYLGANKWEARYGAILLGATSGPTWIPLGSAAAAEADIVLYGKSARNKTDETTLRTSLRALHDRVWAPIEKALPLGTKTVILSPDAQLNFVSFATLLTPGDKFLGEKYSFCYVASGRDLLRELKTSATPSLVAFGNPDFGSEPTAAVEREDASRALAIPMGALDQRDFGGRVLRALPGTGEECMRLEAEATKAEIRSRVFPGAKATEAQLREVQSPRILHLATHGIFLAEPKESLPEDGLPSADYSHQANRDRQVLLKNPMHRSGLALVGAQRTLEAWAESKGPAPVNDGIVTADEVGGLNLKGTWLVTLSACETGIGESQAGEGVLGLRRGFIMAGTQNLLMTLWPIDDEETVKIMLDFYQLAFATGQPPQSLAAVQRDWLVKLRDTKGLSYAVNRAGAFIISFQGKP